MLVILIPYLNEYIVFNVDIWCSVELTWDLMLIPYLRF
jgi:hypothetical protein